MITPERTPTSLISARVTVSPSWEYKIHYVTGVSSGEYLVFLTQTDPECAEFSYGMNPRRPRGKGPCLCAGCIADRVDRRMGANHEV